MKFRTTPESFLIRFATLTVSLSFSGDVTGASFTSDSIVLLKCFGIPFPLLPS